MIDYPTDVVEPVIKFILVSVGSALVIVVSLLMCGKKEDVTAASNESELPYVREVVDIQDQSKEATVESNVQNVQETCEDVKDNAPINEYEPHGKQLHHNTSPSVEQGTSVSLDEDKRKSIPLFKDNQAMKTSDKQNGQADILPNNASGSSDSGNANDGYAKVKRIPAREETAYAVVEIKDVVKDPKYEVVNGNLVRRNVSTESNEEPAQALHQISPDIYDKPNCSVEIKIEETENSGASGYYATVSDGNGDAIPTYIENTMNNSDIYASCGPPILLTGKNVETSELTDLNDKRNSLHPDAIDILLTSRTDCIDTEKDSVKHEDNPNEINSDLGRVKSSKLKHFKSSTKSKKNDDRGGNDKCENVIESSDGKAPPLPSFDKLKHIACHRRNLSSLSDPCSSPELSPRSLSPSGSSSHMTMFPMHTGIPNKGNVSRKGSIDAQSLITPTSEKHHLGHRPRHSEGNLKLTDDFLLKTDLSPMEENMLTEVIVDHSSIPVKHNDNLDKGSSKVHVLLSKSVSQNPNRLDVRNSLISEPDYAEIETEKRLSISDVCLNVAKEEERTTVNSPGYASIDFAKKYEDRRIKSLYATVDYNSKKRNIEGNLYEDNDPLYEGPYNVISETIEDMTMDDHNHDETLYENLSTISDS